MKFRHGLLKLGLVALSLAPIAVRAAEPGAGLDLLTAIQLAEQNQPEYRQAAQALEVASWRRLQAWSGHIPHVSMGASQLADAEFMQLGIGFAGQSLTMPSPVPATLIDLTASWTLFDGWETWRQIEAADLGYAAAALEYTRARFQLGQMIRLRFYQALAAIELLKVADQNLVTLRDHLAIAQAGEHSGLTTHYNVLRIEAQLEEAVAEKSLAEDQAQLAGRALAQALGVAAEDRSLLGIMPVPDPAVLPADLKPDFAGRDDLRALEDRVQAARKGAEAAGGFWWPKLSVYGEEDWYHFSAFDPAIIPTQGLQPSYSVGARLSWNLFDGGASLARQQQALQQAAAAVEGQRAQLLRAEYEFEHWRRHYSSNATLYQARLREQLQSEESVRLAKLAFKAGNGTNTEVLDAELDLFRSRAGIVRAQMDAAEALLNLESALGRRLAP